MARILKNPHVTFAGFQLNSYLREIELSYEVDEKDATVMTDGTIESFPGLKKWRLRGKALQSFTSGEIDDTMFALVGNETAQNVVVRPSTSAKGVNNPEFTGTGYLIKWPPMQGGVGDLHEVDFEIAAASDLARATL